LLASCGVALNTNLLSLSLHRPCGRGRECDRIFLPRIRTKMIKVYGKG
jgi:hypothetical protein